MRLGIQETSACYHHSSASVCNRKTQARVNHPRQMYDLSISHNEEHLSGELLIRIILSSSGYDCIIVGPIHKSSTWWKYSV